MSQITMVTSPNCSYCHAAKQLLQQHRIAYREVNLLTGGSEAQTLMTQSGRRTVPQIFIQQRPIGGYTELAALIDDGQLDVMHSPQL